MFYRKPSLPLIACLPNRSLLRVFVISLLNFSLFFFLLDKWCINDASSLPVCSWLTILWRFNAHNQHPFFLFTFQRNVWKFLHPRNKFFILYRKPTTINRQMSTNHTPLFHTLILIVKNQHDTRVTQCLAFIFTLISRFLHL